MAVAFKQRRSEKLDLYKARTASKPMAAQFKTMQDAIERRKAMQAKHAKAREAIQEHILELRKIYQCRWSGM